MFFNNNIHPNIKIRDKTKNKKSNFKESRGKNEKSGDDMPKVLNDKDIKNILNINSDNIKDIIEVSENFAERISSIPPSKLRDFYDYVVRINEKLKNDPNYDWYIEIIRLKPYLTYQASKESNRNKKEALKILETDFGAIIDRIDKNNINHFRNFKTFFESVVAYHKKYGKGN